MCCALLLESTVSDLYNRIYNRQPWLISLPVVLADLIPEHAEQKLQPVSGDGKRRPSTAETPAIRDPDKNSAASRMFEHRLGLGHQAPGYADSQWEDPVRKPSFVLHVQMH